MTQVEKDKIIAELQEKLAEAEKIEVDEPKRWAPDFGDDYFALYGTGFVDTSKWENDKCDRWRYLTGNCFKTQEEAEEYKKKIEYIARYKNYIEEHSEPIDWKNRNQQKYIAIYSTYDEEIYVENSAYACNQGAVHATSEQIIQDAIKEIGEDNFKKYVLGVK